MKKQKSKIIVVLGPTASGKSELAVRIAKYISNLSLNSKIKQGAEIISADSRQVYKGLNIGTGKVPIFYRQIKTRKSNIFSSRKKTEIAMYYKGIRHHLLDVASPKNRFTVVQYQKLARKTIKEILKRGKIPIICGGTAFYIYALIYNWQLPKVPPQKHLREQLENKNTEELFQQLKKLDPQRAKHIDRYNKRRLIRALEIVLTTGKPIPPLPEFLAGPQKHLFNKNQSEFHILKIGVKKPKQALKKAIKIRLLKRIKQGMIKEVENLHKEGLIWKRLDELGLEYRYISYYLKNIYNFERNIKKTKKKPILLKAYSAKILKEIIGKLNQKIWQFAKRQMTWFKKDKEIKWIKNFKEAKKIIKEFINS